MKKKTAGVSIKSKGPVKKRCTIKRNLGTTRNDRNVPFKSAYVCFSLSKQQEVAKELGRSASVDDIAKRLAWIWKNYSVEEKSVWEKESEKHRNKQEKEKINCFFKTEKKKKDEVDLLGIDSPAFVFYLQNMLPSVQAKNPGLAFKNVQEIIENMWKNTSDEDRMKMIMQEKESRKWYVKEKLCSEKPVNNESKYDIGVGASLEKPLKNPMHNLNSIVYDNSSNPHAFENEDYLHLPAQTSTLSALQRLVNLNHSEQSLDGGLLKGTDINLFPLVGTQNLHHTNAAYVLNSAGGLGLSRRMIKHSSSASVVTPTFTIPSIVTARSLDVRRQLHSQIPGSAYFIDYNP